MKTSNLTFLLYYAAIALWHVKGQELPDAVTWDDLRQTDSKSISSIAENCLASITDKRQHYRTLVEQVKQEVLQSQDTNFIAQKLQKLVTDVAETLQTLSLDINRQLVEGGDRFLKRFQTVTYNTKSSQSEIIQELRAIYESGIDETDSLSISAKHYVSVDFNPTDLIGQFLHQSLTSPSDDIQQFRHTVFQELDGLIPALDEEIREIEKITIEVINRVHKGMVVIKDVRSSLKSSERLPRKWSLYYVKTMLLQATQIVKMLQAVSTNPEENTGTEIDQEGLEVNDESESLLNEESVDSEEELTRDEGDGSGTTHIFSRVKKKLLDELITTVQFIKSQSDIKTMDTRIRLALHEYKDIFNDLSRTINFRIVDYTHLFVKLYKINITIMEVINPETKEQMEEILANKEVNKKNSFYGDIRKFLVENHLSDARMREMGHQIEESMRGARTRAEIQQRTIRQFIDVTNELGKELEAMKIVTAYVLLELQKGVAALNSLQDNSNITGLRYYFNRYDNTKDLQQLRKLVNIMNILDVDQMLVRDVNRLREISYENKAKCHALTEALLEHVGRESREFATEITQISNVSQVREIVTKHVEDYNTIITNYSIRTRKVIKKVVTRFKTICEETVVIFKRKNVKNIEQLEKIIESDDNADDTDAECAVIEEYLGDRTKVNILDRYDVSFEHDMSNTKDVKRTIRKKIVVLTETIMTKIKKIDVAVHSIIEDIVNETQIMQNVYAECQHHDNYVLSLSQFQNLQRLVRISNILHVGNSLKNDAYNNAHVEQLNTAFAEAKKRMQMEKQNMEQGLHQCRNHEQVAFQIVRTATSVRSIIAETVSEMKTNIRGMVSRFGQLLNEYTESSNDSQFAERVRQQEEETSLSEELNAYLEDRYVDRALAGFTNVLNEYGGTENVDEVKQAVSDAFGGSVDRIVSDMENIKAETTSNVIEKLSRGIATLEEIKEGTKQVDEEKIRILAVTASLIKTMQQYLRELDTHHKLKEIRINIGEARESIKKETVKATNFMQSTNEENLIREELFSTVDRLDIIYNDLRNTVQSKLNECSTKFLSIYKAAMEKEKLINPQLEATMRNIINGKTNFSQDEHFNSARSYIKSEDYTSALVRKLFNADSVSTIGKETGLQQVQKLSTDVVESINRMEAAVQYISYNLEQNVELVKSIGSSTTQHVDHQQIESLAKIVSLAQMLCTVEVANGKPDFKIAKSIIDEEYTKAKLAIENATEDELVEMAMSEALQHFNQIFIDLRETTKLDFSQTASDFSTMYNSVIESNPAARNVWQEIEQRAYTIDQSQGYKVFQEYLQSESCKSSFTMHSSYQGLLETDATTIERLTSLTTDVKQRVSQMESVSSFVSRSFQEATDILKSMNSGDVRLTQEQTHKLSEAFLVYQALSSSESDIISTRSLNNESDNLEASFANAQFSINKEYENASNAIKMEEKRSEEIVTSTVNYFNDIFNDLSHTVTTQWHKTLQTYTSCLESGANRISAYQETINKYDYSLLRGDTEYQRIFGFITSGTYVTDAVKQWYKNIQTSSSFHQLDSITTKLNEQITEMKFANDYLQHSFAKGTEIITALQNDASVKLDEQQIRIMAINAMISKIVTNHESGGIASETKIKISEELEAAINQIRSTTDQSQIQQIIHNSINTSDNFFNTMKENVDIKLEQCSETFRQHFAAVMLTIRNRGSTEMQNIFKNISQAGNSSADTVTKFEKWINSDVHQSKSSIANMFNSIQQTNNMDTNVKEHCIEQMTTLNFRVKETITETEIIVEQVTENFKKGEEILHQIQNNENIRLTEEQIQLLSQNYNFVQAIDTTKTSHIDFSQLKTTIADEYRNIISSIAGINDQEKVQQMVAEGVERSQGIYNNLRAQVTEQMSRSCSDFKQNYEIVSSALQARGITEEILQNTSIDVVAYEYLNKCRSFVTGFYFQSNSAITEAYQQIRETKYPVQDHVKNLSVQVADTIDQMEATSKFVTNSLSEASNLLKNMQTQQDIQLTQKQIQTLSLGQEIVKIVEQNLNTSAKSINTPTFVQKSEFADTKKRITRRYDNAINAIQFMNDQEAVKSTIMETIKNSEEVYNELRQKVYTTITQNCAEIDKLFESTQSREILQQTSQTNDKFKKFESYMTSNQFKSKSAVAEMYNRIQNQKSLPYADTNERNVEEMKMLSQQVAEKITEMQEINEYIAECLQQGSALLQNLRGQNTELAEEQRTVLSVTRAITKLVATTSNEGNSVSTQQPSTEADFNEAKSTITRNYENTIAAIKSMQNENTVQDTVAQTVQNSDIVFGELKSKVQIQVAQSCSNFKQDFESTLSTIVQQNSQAAETLRRVVVDQNHEIIRKLKSYFVAIESGSTIANLYRGLQQNVESSYSVAERSVENLKMLNTMVVEKIDEMKETSSCVTQTLQQGQQLLQTIRGTPQIQLTEEQINLLSLSRGIVQAMNNSANVSTSQEVDFVNAKTTITSNYENTINEIRSMQNENSIRDTIAKTVQNTDQIYTDLRSQVQNQMTESCSSFQQNYEAALSAARQCGNTQAEEALRNAVLQQTHTDTSVQRLESYVSDHSYQSRSPVTEMFNQIRQNANSEIHERSIQQVKTLNAQVIDSINKMEEMKEYVRVNGETAVEILKCIQNDSNAQLNEDQIQSISLTERISKILTNPTSEVPTDSHNAKTIMARDLEATVNAVRVAENEEAITKIVADSVQKCENTYNTLRERVRSEIVEHCADFQQAYQGTLTRVRQQGNTEVEKKLQNATNQILTEESLKKFNSFVTGGNLISNTVVSDMYNSIQQTRNLASTENAVDRNIQQIQTLNDRLAEQIDQMEEINKYVFEIQHQGKEILQQIQQHNDVQLTDEQFRIISISNQINESASKNLNVNSAAKYEQNQALTDTTTKEMITAEYDNAIKTIASATDERTVQEIVERTVQNTQRNYNNLQSQIQHQMIENSHNFERNYESVISVTNQPSNEIRELLQNIKTHPTYTDERITKLESYVSNGYFGSSTAVTDTFEGVQKNLASQTFANANERSIGQVKDLKTKVAEKLTEMDEMNRYVAESLQEGATILETIKAGNIDNLTEDQVNTLSRNARIVQAMHQHLPAQPINVREVDFSGAKTKTQQQFTSTIDSIRSTNNVDVIKEAVKVCVGNSENVYNDLKTQTQNKITENCSHFQRDYEAAMAKVQQKGEHEIEKVLQDVNYGPIQNDAILKKFEICVAENQFNSNSVVADMYNRIQQTETQSSENVGERNVREIQTLNTQLQEKINDIEEIENYINENLQQGTQILRKIQQEENVQLTPEEIQILSTNKRVNELTSRISQQPNTPANHPVDTKIAAQPTSQANHPIKTKITGQYENTINEIRAMSDAEEIEKTVMATVRDSETNYKNYREQIQSKTAQICTTFENDYKLTLTTAQNDDQLKEILQNLPERTPSRSNTSFKKFESFVASTRDTSSTPVMDMFNAVRKTDASTTTTNERRDVEQLQTLSGEINENIDALEENANYVRQSLQQASDILQGLRNSKNRVQLSEEQTETLIVANRITLLLAAPETARQPVDISAAKTRIENEHSRSIRAIESANDEKQLRNVEAESVRCYGDVYENIKQNVREEVRENSFDYGRNYKTAMGNERVAAMLETIPDNTTANESFTDIETQLEEMNSSSGVNEMYKKLQQPNATIDGARCIQQLDTLKSRITENVDNMARTSEQLADNFEKGSQILQQLQKDENARLTEDQIRILALNNKIAQTITRDEFEQVKSVKKEDFDEVEAHLKEEVDNTINEIQTMQDEESIKQAVVIGVREQEFEYNHLLDNVQANMDQNSHRFAENLESTIKHVRKNGKLRNILREIADHRSRYKPENNAQYRKFESNVNNEIFTAPTPQADMETDDISDVKECSIHHLQTVNDEVTKRVDVLAETNTYVIENLEKGTQILREIEESEDVELSPEEIEQLAVCVSITETVITQTEIIEKKTVESHHQYDDIYTTVYEDDDSITVKTTKTSTVVEEIEEVIETEVEDEGWRSTRELSDQPQQCVSKNNLTFVSRKRKAIQSLSINDLLVNWSVTKSANQPFPVSCRQLSWTNERYKQCPQDYEFVRRIVQILQTTRRITLNTIQLQQERTKLYRQPQDLLAVFVNAVQSLSEILQQTSWAVREDLHQLTQSFHASIGNRNTIQSQLAGRSSTLDADFVKCSKCFYSLANCKETNLLDIIDEPFTTSYCATLDVTSDVVGRKFEKLKLIMETILNNVDCATLASIDAILSGKIQIESDDVRPEILRNSFGICDLVDNTTDT